MGNKIAIVTGGSRGLGKNTVLSLAQKGVDVILTFNRQQAEAEAVVAQVKALGREAAALQLDVSSARHFTAFTEQVSATLRTRWQQDSFDYLVNNAGAGVHASFAEPPKRSSTSS